MKSVQSSKPRGSNVTVDTLEDIAPVNIAPGTSLAVPAPTTTGFSGDWIPDDLRLPKLGLHHPVDQRHDDVQGGHFVLAKSNEDYLPLVPPFEITVVRAEKGYLEANPEPGDSPLYCHTRAEVEAAGGTLDRNRPDATLYQPMADTWILVDASARQDWGDYPTLSIGKDCRVVAATYRLKSTAFQEVGTALASWEAYRRMGGHDGKQLLDMRWQLSSVLRKGKTFSYHIPVLKSLGAHAADVSETLREIAANL